MTLFVANAQLLIDAADDATAYAVLARALEIARQSVPEPDRVLDATPSDMRLAHAQVVDLVERGAYASGDAFADWVLYSPSVHARSGSNGGYYAASAGWNVHVRLATRFDGAGTLPMPGSPGDARFVLAREALADRAAGAGGADVSNGGPGTGAR